MASFGTPLTRKWCTRRGLVVALVGLVARRSRGWGQGWDEVPRLHRNDGGGARRGKLLIWLHSVSFSLISLVDGAGAETETRVGGATAGLSRWDRDRLRWCTLATPGIGPGSSRPRHACRNLVGVCKWVTRAGGTEPGLCCSIGIIVNADWHTYNCLMSRWCRLLYGALGWDGWRVGRTLGMA